MCRSEDNFLADNLPGSAFDSVNHPEHAAVFRDELAGAFIDDTSMDSPGICGRCYYPYLYDYPNSDEPVAAGRSDCDIRIDVEGRPKQIVDYEIYPAKCRLKSNQGIIG